jgi:hypothetical protein
MRNHGKLESGGFILRTVRWAEDGRVWSGKMIVCVQSRVFPKISSAASKDREVQPEFVVVFCGARRRLLPPLAVPCAAWFAESGARHSW